MNDDLKKKGLRRVCSGNHRPRLTNERRPEKEGIKTQTARSTSEHEIHGMNDDLKKKGLRQARPLRGTTRARNERRPEKEGIKTSCSLHPPYLPLCV